MNSNQKIEAEQLKRSDKHKSKTALNDLKRKKRKRLHNSEEDETIRNIASAVKHSRSINKARHHKYIDDSDKTKKNTVDSWKAEWPDSGHTNDSGDNSDSGVEEFVADGTDVLDDVSFGLEPNMDNKRKLKRPVLSLGELVEARHKKELISSLLSNDAIDKSVKQKQAASHSDEQQSIKSELEKLSLVELQQLKEKIGLKMDDEVTNPVKKQKKESKFFQPVKKKPQEQSSKRRAPILRNTLAKKKVQRDPRFDDLSGTYNEEHFKTDYAFLDDIKKREKHMLKVALHREDNPERREKISAVLNKMHNQDTAEKEKEKQKGREEQWKQTESQRVQEGKTPYFLKQSDKRKLELADKFQELKQSGKLDDYLAKKRKKNMHKQRRKLPGERDN